MTPKKLSPPFATGEKVYVRQGLCDEGELVTIIDVEWLGSCWVIGIETKDGSRNLYTEKDLRHVNQC